MSDEPASESSATGDDGLETLVIGVDAACPAVLDPLFEAGEVPRLESLFVHGASGSLRSSMPPWTPSAWPTLYTGTNPGKHGVFGFLAFRGYDWEVVDATHVRERPLWELLALQGRSSVVVNAPVTHPPRPFDGALVPGYAAPDPPACHPEGLYEELQDALGGYRIYPPADPEVADYRALVEARGEAFRYLADRFGPAFGFVQFQATDTVVHDRPGDRAALAAVYRAVDEQVGAVLDACEPATTVVVSDHGIGPYGGSEFRVNEFLRDRGFVETRTGGPGMPSWATVRDGDLADRGGRAGGRGSRLTGASVPLAGSSGRVAGPVGGLAGRSRGAATAVLERLLVGLARLGVTSQRAERVLATVGLAEPVAERVPARLASAATEQVDFPRSRAYMRSRVECGVRINLAGREPDGVVSPSEYETVRADVVDALSAVRTPDGVPVFEEVAPRERFYHGPAVDRAPDVVAVPNGFDQFLSATLAGERFGEPTEPWNHKREGVFAARGAAVDESADVDGARLEDVAPTVLATLGVPADERMDGEVLAPVAPAGERAYPAYDPGAPSGTDDPAVERHLADLGYLEGP